MTATAEKWLGFEDARAIARAFEVGGFKSYGDENEPENLPEGFPSPDDIVVAAYEIDGYEGSAFVLFTRDGKLFENHGGHCSCYGLEDQWAPEETTAAALRLRLDQGDYGVVNTEPVKALIRAFLDTFDPTAGYQGA